MLTKNKELLSLHLDAARALQSILHADSKLTIAIGEFSSSSPSVLINSDWAEQRIRSLKEIIHTEKRRYEVILEKN